MRRTIISMLAAATLMLAGCADFTSGSGNPSAPSPAATAGTGPDASRTKQIAVCTAAIVAAKNDTADNGLPECAKLSPDDYLTALQDADKQVRDASQRQSGKASASASAQ